MTLYSAGSKHSSIDKMVGVFSISHRSFGFVCVGRGSVMGASTFDSLPPLLSSDDKRGAYIPDIATILEGGERLVIDDAYSPPF